MSYIGKPKVVHPKLPRNKLGLSKRDYEGVASTLCAGCGHDSITAAIIQAVFELDIEPHKLAKMSGIITWGCAFDEQGYFIWEGRVGPWMLTKHDILSFAPNDFTIRVGAREDAF